MQQSFGNIANISLADVVSTPDFRKYWDINKDEINNCRDCEFRYICTDCRAYLSNPDDDYSQPLKCGYNPENCEWDDWASNPLKQKAIQYYKAFTENHHERIPKADTA